MLTKKQSKVLQGVAILMMMFHHFFSYNDAKFIFLFPTFSLNLAWFGKICVGLFAFISGYGIFYVLNSIRKNSDLVLKKQYIELINRLFRLLLKYWLVIVIHILISVIAFGEKIEAPDIIKNALLIDFSFNGSWWFVRQYAMMLIIAPVIDALLFIFTKKEKRIFGIVMVVAGATALVILNAKVILVSQILDFVRPAFMVIFIMGYLIAYFNVYAFIEKLLRKNCVMEIITGMVIISLVFYLRTLLAADPSYARGDFIFVPCFAFGFILITKHLKGVSYVLEQLGIHSTFMWLLHINIFGRTSEFICNFTNRGIIIYIIEVILSFVFSWGLLKIGGLLCEKFRPSKTGE